MQDKTYHNLHARNGQTPPDGYNQIESYVKRIAYFARLYPNASASFADFWLGQISYYHGELKKGMVNPILRGGK